MYFAIAESHTLDRYLKDTWKKYVFVLPISRNRSTTKGGTTGDVVAKI